MTKRYQMMLFPINNSGEVIEKKETLDMKEQGDLITTTELAKKLGLKKNDLVLEATKKVLPNKIIENGKATYFNEMEATVIIKYIKDNANRKDLVTYQTGLEGVKTTKSDDLDFLIMLKQKDELQKKIDAYKDKKIKELEEENKQKTEQIQVLENKIEEDKKYVDFGKSIENNEKGTMDFGEFSKQTKLGRTKLFRKCRELKILYRDYNDINVPYQKYIDNGYFKTTTIFKNNMMLTKTLITGKGVIWLKNKIGE